MGGETLWYGYPWRSFSSASLALVVVMLLLIVSPSVRATSPQPIVASHMDLLVGLSTAKTYDLQTVTIHDYTTVYQPPLNQTGNQTGNSTSNGTTTLIPSPGPVLVSLYSANGAPITSIGGVFNLSDGIYVLSFAITPDFGFDTVSIRVRDFSLNRTSAATFTVDLSETYKYILLQRWESNASAWLTSFTEQKEAGRDTAALIENVGFAFVWLALVLVTLHRIARKHGTLSWVDRLKLGTKATLYVDPTAQALDPEGYNADGVAELQVQDIRKESKDLEKLMLSDLREATMIAGLLDMNDEERTFLESSVRSLREHRGLDPVPKERRVVQFGGGVQARAGPIAPPVAFDDVGDAPTRASTPPAPPKEGEKPRGRGSKRAPRDEEPSEAST